LFLEEFTTIYHKVPRVAVDIVIKTKQGALLTKRVIPSFKGMWHIPGGTILFKEPILHAINRIAKDELGIKVKVIKHLGVIEYLKEGTPRGSNQAKEIGYFKRPPKNCVPPQKNS